MQLVTIVVVCIIFVFVSQPVDRFLKKKVLSKWLLVIARLLSYWVIFMILYGIAALLGFKIWEK